jgi:cation transport regulator ChaB
MFDLNRPVPFLQRSFCYSKRLYKANSQDPNDMRKGLLASHQKLRGKKLGGRRPVPFLQRSFCYPKRLYKAKSQNPNDMRKGLLASHKKLRGKKLGGHEFFFF